MPPSRCLTVILAACFALVVAGCGTAGKGKLSSAQGERLNGYVERAQAAFDDRRCADARTAAGEGARRVARLKGRVDPDLRQNLIDGFNHLEQQLASNCDKPETTSTPAPTITTAPTEAPTVTASPSPEPTESPSPSPTATDAPTVTATPDGTGGATSDGQGTTFDGSG